MATALRVLGILLMVGVAACNQATNQQTINADNVRTNGGDFEASNENGSEQTTETAVQAEASVGVE